MLKQIGLLILLIITCNLNAQETEEIQHEKEEAHENEERHSFTVVISHAYISQGKIDGKRSWIAAPAFGLNYNFKINEKWSIGLHTDIILESFVIENSSETEDLLEREFPISNLVVGTYKLSESWGIALGAGIEWERNENFAMFRIGTDYGLELNKKGLEVVFTLNYDILIDAYDSFNFGLGINKFFK